jgi:hypothetical protein
MVLLSLNFDRHIQINESMCLIMDTHYYLFIFVNY